MEMRWLIRFLTAAILVVGGLSIDTTALGNDVSSQTIISALDNAALPSVLPNFVQNERTSARQVSQAERSRGVIAYYSVAINYDKLEITLGLTYRIFRDHHAAALYAKHLSVFDSPGFKAASGFPLTETRVSSPNKWPSRNPYTKAVCDFFANASSPNLATARCSALHADLPVIVSGIRIQTVQFDQSGGRAKYRFDKDQEHLEYGYAMELLDTGMVRLEDIEHTGR